MTSQVAEVEVPATPIAYSTPPWQKQTAPSGGVFGPHASIIKSSMQTALSTTLRTVDPDLHTSSTPSTEALASRETGSGDPMILVHGNISDLRTWSSLEPLLARQFRVFSYSRRFSHPNPPAAKDTRDSLFNHVDDLVDIIERQRLGKVHLVGNSSGAFVCLLLAARRPHLVQTLTLLEPPVISMFLRQLPPRLADVLRLLFTQPVTLIELLRFGAGVIRPSTKAFESGEDELAVEIFARGVLGQTRFASLSRPRRQQILDNAMAHRALLLGAGLPVFAEEHAASIQTPTQLICGSETPRFQQRINQRLAAFIPGSREICIPNASHFAHEDNAFAVSVAISDFCFQHTKCVQPSPGGNQ